MATRLIAYDPDPAARDLLRRWASSETHPFHLTLHPTPQACLRDLAAGTGEVLALGLPMPGSTLAALLLAAHRAEPPPALVFLGEPPEGCEAWVPKTPDGLRRLAEVAVASLRIRGIDALSVRLEGVPIGLWAEGDISLAMQLLMGLDAISLSGALVRPSTEPHGWQILVTTLPRAATEALASHLAAGTGRRTGAGDGAWLKSLFKDRRSLKLPAHGSPRVADDSGAETTGLPVSFLALPTRGSLRGALVMSGQMGEGEIAALGRLGSALTRILHELDSQPTPPGSRTHAGWKNEADGGLRPALAPAGADSPESQIAPVLQRLVAQAASALGLPRGLIVLRLEKEDGDEVGCQVSASVGVDEADKQALCHAVWQIGTAADKEGRGPRVLTRADNRMRALEAFRVRSALVVPVQHQGNMLGCMMLDRPGEPVEIDPTALALAASIADQAAIAVDHALIVGDLRRQSEELTSLYDLGIQLSHELTVEGVVDRVFTLIQGLIDIDAAVVARLGAGEVLDCDVLDFGRRLPALRVPLDGQSLSGVVIRSGQPLWIRDYVREADSLPVPGLTAGEEIASWLGVPLIARGQTIGAVSVQSERPHQFNSDHLRLLRMIANHTAVALDNAMLLQATASQADKLRLVNEIGRFAVSVLDTQNLVREVTLRIQQSFRLYSVGILLLEGGILVPQAVVRGPKGELLRIGRTLTVRERSIVAEVARTGRPLLVPDVSQDARYRPALELSETAAELAVPLMVGNEVVGVLDVQSEQVGGLTEADRDLLQALAAQVAISVVNARLFAEVRAHTAQLEARVTARTAEIRSQKERTEAILRSVADAVVVLDLEGAWVLTNPVAQELLRGPQGREVKAQILRMHAQGGVVTETLDLGQMTFQALASPVTLGNLAVGTVVVLRDITRLRELDRLKSHFVATVSHELRTPLANIRVYLSLLRKGHQQRRGQYLQVLDQETGRLSAMIEELLDLSRLDDQQVGDTPEPVSLAPILSLVLDSHRPSAQAKGVDIVFEGGPWAAVMGHRSQLIRVFANLVSNAIQYTPSGGHVRLRVEGVQRVGGVNMALVSVADDGQGIPVEDLPYIFDRFYRGSLARSNNVPGSGLGLAIVREIVDRHRGRVEVSSRLGEGSVFQVFLPVVEE